MLTVYIPKAEQFDESNNRFIKTKAQVLQLEHSLVSISKWESKWHKAFLSTTEKKTTEQVIDYIRCMTLTQNVDPNVYYAIPSNVMEQINDYISNPMTATTFRNNPNAKPNREVVTSELIYYWMIANNIPVEFQKWHLNRLMTLIRICSIKNAPPKKMNSRDILSQNKALNAARRKANNSKG